MKNLIIFLTLISFFSSANAQEQGCGKVYSYVVFLEKNGNILSEERSEKFSYPASLVKMMTLYLTFEAIENQKLKPETVLTISQRGEEISAVNKVNTMFLKEGDKIKVSEAIRAVIVKSFNEAAVTLGEAVAGSEWEFARQMNKKAQELGMINSSFYNASGLHAEGQYSTSFDLARLSSAIKKDFPKYYHLFSLKEFSYNGKNYETHNHVLMDYKGAEGMKTGFTNASGYNLISAAKKNDARIISVLLGCETYQKRDEFTKELLNKAFEKISAEANHKNIIEVKLTKNFDYAKHQQRRDSYEEEMHFGMALFE